MGLLGDSWDDPRTMATLQLAAGLLSGGGLGQALGRGLSGYQQTMAADEERRQKKAMRDAQMEETRAQALERDMRAKQVEAQMQAQQRRLQALPSLFGGGTQTIGGDVLAPTEGGQPMFSQGVQVTPQQQVTSPQRFDFKAALQAGYTPEEIQKMAALQDLGRQEVARTLETTDAQGRPITLQLDKFGQPIGQGMAQWKAPMQVNQGDRVSFVNPVDLKPQGAFGINMSPSERDASARGWASNSIAQQRLALDRAKANEGDAPQYKDGQWVMPPKGLRPGESFNPTARKDAVEALNLIEQAKKIIPDATGSGFGTGVDAVGRFFGATTKGDMKIGQLQAIEGALVSKMPKMSGPQSDKDVELYKQMAGVIGDPTMPPERKKAALEQIEEIQRRYAGDAAPPVEPQQPKPQVMTSMPTPNGRNKGRVLIVEQTGQRLRSNGMQWVPE